MAQKIKEMAGKAMAGMDKLSIFFGMKNSGEYSDKEISSSMNFFEQVATPEQIEEIRKFYHDYSNTVDGENNF